MVEKIEVAGFGALNVDKIFRVPRIAGRDEESFILKNEGKSMGGSAANTIVGLSRLGIKTSYLGKLGDDEEGKFYLGELEKEGVETNNIIISHEGKTGEVTAFVEEEGERSMYVDPGVNDELNENEAMRAIEKMNLEFLHLTSFVGNNPFAAQKVVVDEQGDIRISFDPGDLYVRKGLTALKPILEKSEVVFLNEKELEGLTKEKGWKDGAKLLLRLGVSKAVIKLGDRGCYIATDSEDFQVEAYAVAAVDTTGAGDAFNAGFLYGLIKNKSLEQSGKIGNFVASKCITKYGARNGLPTLEELQEENLK